MKDFLKFVVFGGLFLVPALTLYVENDYFFPFITGKNFGFRIIVDIVVAAWVLLALYDRTYRPKFSGILATFVIFLGVMFFANLFGENPTASFWSNFERMDGYVSLVHTFLYALVLGSVLTERRHWTALLNTSVVIATMVALYGLAQYSGLVEGGGRIDSRLGNAAYMAVYMLFHIFFLIWLFISTKNTGLRALYAFLALVFTFVLFETGTRGTALGLVTGMTGMALYLAITGRSYPLYRKIAIGGLLAVAVVVGGLVSFKDSALVQSQPNLSRIANISLEDLTVRGTIWGMAWEGVQERPVLGWGQSNFNYVFNEQYEPSLYDQEQWFDRAHNIFLDWLIAGGWLGLLAYLAIFVSLAYYLVWTPWRHGDERFTVLERAVLIGLVVGYFTHNLVVFDNIVSYIFFAITLGLIHARVGSPITKIANAKVDDAIILQVAVPATVAVLAAVFYFVHLPGMGAAGDIIDAFKSPTPEGRLAAFESALDRDSFAHQEITEQLAQQTITIMSNPNIAEETKQQFAQLTEGELNELVAAKPNDARVRVFLATYYRSAGDLERADFEMQKARELSPMKQSIIVQQGFTALAENDAPKAVGYFKEAFDLAPENLEAREYYTVGLLYAGDTAAASQLMAEDERALPRFAISQYVLQAANQVEAYGFLLPLLTYKLEQDTTSAQNWASLAFVQYKLGSTTAALDTLAAAGEAVPGYAATAQCVADNITSGREPNEGC